MKSIKITRLEKSLRVLNDWANDNYPIRENILRNYFDGSGCLYDACRELFRTGMTNIGRTLSLSNTQSFSTKKQFTNSSNTLLIAKIFLLVFHKKNFQIGAATLDDLTQLLLSGLATGQVHIIKPCHTELIDALEKGYGVSDGHDLPLGTTLRYAAFGLTIIGDWLGKPLDLDKHALPRDPAWGQLVAHWREPDPEKILPILLAACDTHVERIALTSRELDSGRFEFGSPFEAVYPAEILAIINLRRSLGLTTPFIDHPLMKTPYAALTLPPGTLLERDDLLMRFLDAVRRYDPEAMPEGLYEAVSCSHGES